MLVIWGQSSIREVAVIVTLTKNGRKMLVVGVIFLISFNSCDDRACEVLKDASEGF